MNSLTVSGKWGSLLVCAGSGRVLDYDERGTLDKQPPTNRGYAVIGKIDLPSGMSPGNRLEIAACGLWLACGDYLAAGSMA